MQPSSYILYNENWLFYLHFAHNLHAHISFFDKYIIYFFAETILLFNEV